MEGRSQQSSTAVFALEGTCIGCLKQLGGVTA
jgi:hypothetical protein